MLFLDKIYEIQKITFIKIIICKTNGLPHSESKKKTVNDTIKF